MGAKPKVIHFGDGFEQYCDAEPIDWAEKYMTDEFARSLPKCPDCLAIREQRFGKPYEDTPTQQTTQPLIEQVLPPKSLNTLRMFLTT